MTTFQRLKHEARKAEQRSDWRRAISLYREAMRYDEQLRGASELGLFNRVGDLHIRLGEVAQAVECYEQAAERYAENDLPTSAIALCNKILRIAPDRADVFRRLCLLHAATGLLAEARGSLLQYVDRMERDGNLGAAFETVQEFVGITGDDTIRVQVADLLAERGHASQAQAQLRLAADASRKRGIEPEELEERIEQLSSPGLRTGTAEAHVSTGTVPDGFVPEAREAVDSDHREETGDPLSVTPAAPVRLGEQLNEAIPEFRSYGAATVPAASMGVSREDASVPDVTPGPVAEALRRFRARVQPELDRAAPEQRYDLGVAFQTMGLDAAALREFRYGIAAPGRLRATNERIARILNPRTGEPDAPQVSGVREPVELSGPDGSQSVELREPDGPDIEVPPIVVPDVEPPRPDPESASFEREQAPPESRDAESLGPDLQGLLFRARLAQHQIRRAQDAGRTDHRSYLELGSAYAEMGLRDEAIRELFEAVGGPNPVGSRAVSALLDISRDPDTEWEQALSVVERLRDLGHSALAAPVLHELLGRWGEDHPAAGRLGELLGWVVKPAAEAEELDERQSPGPAVEPESPAAQAVAEPFGADSASLQVLDELLDQLEDDSIGSAAPRSAEPSEPAEVLEEAERMLSTGREEEATSLLYRALERFEDARAMREAATILERLLELRPDDVVLHHQRAEFALTLNDRDLLLSSYMRLAASLRRQNAHGHARTVYARILDIDPDHREARAAIEQFAHQPPRDGTENAEPVRESGHAGASTPGVRRRLPHVPEDRAEFDSLLGELRDPGPGADTFEGDPEAHLELGIAFKQMEMWDEAITELQRAAAGLSDPIRVWVVQAECLERAGRTAEALEVQYQLGLALQERGDTAGAVRCFSGIVNVDGSFRDAAARLSALSQ